MFEKNTPKIVKIKLEPQENDIREEEQTNSYTKKDQVLELQENKQSIEQVVDTLRSSIIEQTIAFDALRKRCDLLEKQNNELKQTLDSQKQDSQKLYQSAINKSDESHNVLKNEQNNKLATHIDQTTTMVDGYIKKTESTIAKFQTELTLLQQKEQSHHQLLLSQYRALEKKVDVNKDVYNDHTHNTIISQVGACADIAARHGHAWGHSHTASMVAPTPKMN
jgi:myosin heavy subunit